MEPRFAEDLDEEIGTAIDHFGLIGEVGGAIDHAKDLHHTLDPVEIAQRRLRGGQDLQSDLAGGGIALFDGEGAPDLSARCGVRGPVPEMKSRLPV